MNLPGPHDLCGFCGRRAVRELTDHGKHHGWLCGTCSERFLKAVLQAHRRGKQATLEARP
jgi:hypothetical protein